MNKKTFMFQIVVNHGYKFTTHYTNVIMSKNDGALVAFRDENDEMLNESPLTVSVSLNIDEKTGMSKPISKPDK